MSGIFHHFNITGRRASLNVRAIRHILERVRAYGITVNDFYIVTNGSATSRSEEFIEACAALYEYQEEKEQDSGHMLEMSDDRSMIRQSMPPRSRHFPRIPFSESGDRPSVSSFSGKAAARRGFRTCSWDLSYGGDYVYGDLCLNAEGMVLSNGDLSYAANGNMPCVPAGN